MTIKTINLNCGVLISFIREAMALQEEESGDSRREVLYTKPTEVRVYKGLIDAVSYTPSKEGGTRPPMTTERRQFLKLLCAITVNWFDPNVDHKRDGMQ